jgi:hypothetical protein
MVAYATTAKSRLIIIDCNMVKSKRSSMGFDSSAIDSSIIEDSASING